jgi:hypothetical protein
MKRLSFMAGIAGAIALCAGTAGATTLSLSVGSGGQFNGSTGTTSNVAPLATELSIGFNLAPRVTLDASFLFAHDVDSSLPANLRSSYVGFRPGLRAYLGSPFSSLQPYLRVAIPVQYNTDTKTTDLGFLAGGGLEFRFARSIGVFGEVLVSPYFTNEHLVPVEGRIGLAVHF